MHSSDNLLSHLPTCYRVQCLSGATPCSRPVPLWGPGMMGDSGPDSWTALHGAIAGDNSALVDALLKEGQQDLDSNYYAHFLACTNAGSTVCDQIISACSSSATYSALLNFPGSCTGTARPLHLAARARNPHALSRLLRCSKVDPNARDNESELTAVHETCLRDDIEMLHMFGQFADRLDLLSVDSRGKTCIDVAIDSKNVEMLKLLVKMRRNDVLERVLRVSSGPSLLVQLEEENLSMAHALGYVTDSGQGRRAERADDELIVICETTVDGLVQALQETTIDDSTVLPFSTAPLKCLDPGHGDKLDIPNSTSVSCTALPTTQMLLEGNQILRVLISAANDAGIPDQYHYHACFSKGLLFTEFVENENH
jgi:Ankyrin repeats (3 copies)